MKDTNCIFCKIANGEIPSTSLYENEDFRVILDLGPATKGHALILPKEHFSDLTTLDADIAAKVFPLAGKIGRSMQRALGCSGFNVVQNNGASAGQTVMHFHTHIIPRYKGDGEMVLWTPGTTTPEEMKQIAETVGKCIDE